MKIHPFTGNRPAAQSAELLHSPQQNVKENTAIKNPLGGAGREEKLAEKSISLDSQQIPVVKPVCRNFHNVESFEEGFNNEETNENNEDNNVNNENSSSSHLQTALDLARASREDLENFAEKSSNNNEGYNESAREGNNATHYNKANPGNSSDQRLAISSEEPHPERAENQESGEGGVEQNIDPTSLDFPEKEIAQPNERYNESAREGNNATHYNKANPGNSSDQGLAISSEEPHPERAENQESGEGGVEQNIDPTSLDFPEKEIAQPGAQAGPEEPAPDPLSESPEGGFKPPICSASLAKRWFFNKGGSRVFFEILGKVGIVPAPKVTLGVNFGADIGCSPIEPTIHQGFGNSSKFSVKVSRTSFFYEWGKMRRVNFVPTKIQSLVSKVEKGFEESRIMKALPLKSDFPSVLTGKPGGEERPKFSRFGIGQSPVFWYKRCTMYLISHNESGYFPFLCFKKKHLLPSFNNMKELISLNSFFFSFEGRPAEFVKRAWIFELAATVDGKVSADSKNFGNLIFNDPKFYPKSPDKPPFQALIPWEKVKNLIDSSAAQHQKEIFSAKEDLIRHLNLLSSNSRSHAENLIEKSLHQNQKFSAKAQADIFSVKNTIEEGFSGEELCCLENKELLRNISDKLEPQGVSSGNLALKTLFGGLAFNALKTYLKPTVQGFFLGAVVGIGGSVIYLIADRFLVFYKIQRPHVKNKWSYDFLCVLAITSRLSFPIGIAGAWFLLAMGGSLTRQISVKYNQIPLSVIPSDPKGLEILKKTLGFPFKMTIAFLGLSSVQGRCALAKKKPPLFFLLLGCSIFFTLCRLKVKQYYLPPTSRQKVTMRVVLVDTLLVATGFHAFLLIKKEIEVFIKK